MFGETFVSYHQAMLPLAEQFGPIDIYLFDQILRGRVTRGMRILDAGCGEGRNLVYLLQNAGEQEFEIFGVDRDFNAIAAIRRLSARLAPHLPADNFRVEAIETMSFPDAMADFVISSAVLHFATDDHHFQKMLQGIWRTLKPGGVLFCRLASSIGIESEVRRLDGRRCLLPDGSERYLVDEPLLSELAEKMGARLADPLKTTVVQHQRSMTTWVLQKTH